LLSQLPVIIVGDFFVNFIFITQVRTKEYILRESESPLTLTNASTSKLRPAPSLVAKDLSDYQFWVMALFDFVLLVLRDSDSWQTVENLIKLMFGLSGQGIITAIEVMNGEVDSVGDRIFNKMAGERVNKKIKK
jgi:hypothetical protein